LNLKKKLLSEYTRPFFMTLRLIFQGISVNIVTQFYFNHVKTNKFSLQHFFYLTFYSFFIQDE